MFKFLIDLIFPKYCYFCKREGRYLCSDCIRSYMHINWRQNCYVCGRSCSSGFTHDECKDAGYLDGLLYLTLYDKKIREIIKDIKYNYYFDVLNEIGKLMSEYLELYKFENVTLCDVPLHRRKENYRGFNQSELLAKVIARSSYVPFLNMLERVEDTVSQVTLTKEDREGNLVRAFRIKNNVEVPKTILLIDDVYTTGATLNQCAKILKENGANEVYGFVFAKSREGV